MFFLSRIRFSKKQLIKFNQALADLLKAGFSVKAALEIIKDNDQSSLWLDWIKVIQSKIEQGFKLSDTLSLFPNYYANYQLALIQCGENSGHLALCLHQLAQQQRAQLQFNSQLRSALIYPAFILISSLSLSALIIEYLLPSFAQLFNEAQTQLPALTQNLLVLSQKLPRFIGLFILSLSFILTLLGLSLKLNFNWRWKIKRLSLNLPLFGKLIQLWQITQWLNLMVHYLQAALPLLTALELAEAAFSHDCYRVLYHEALNNIRLGFSLKQSLSAMNCFPKNLVAQIALAEQSAQLSEQLTRCHEDYQYELKNRLNQLTQWLEPLSLLLVSSIIGMLVIALYLPIFSMGEIF